MRLNSCSNTGQVITAGAVLCKIMSCGGTWQACYAQTTWPGLCRTARYLLTLVLFIFIVIYCRSPVVFIRNDFFTNTIYVYLFIHLFITSFYLFCLFYLFHLIIYLSICLAHLFLPSAAAAASKSNPSWSIELRPIMALAAASLSKRNMAPEACMPPAANNNEKFYK